MIAPFRIATKLGVIACLSLAACTAAPFLPPRATPTHPIITSGVFHLAGGANLPYRLYPANGPVKAVVLALHGYTDSRDGWLILSKPLNRAGITIYAPDQSGFGATETRGQWPGTAALVDQAREMALLLKARYPHARLFIMGESMGGAIALLLGASPHPPPVTGYIISAPAVWGGTALNPAYRITLKLANIFAPQARLTGSQVKIQASDNIPALIAFGSDPLTLQAPSIGNIAGLVTLMGQAQAACAHFNQPGLILYGGHDQLIPKPAMISCWSKIPATSPVMLAYYPADYHLITRDLERAVPTADIIGTILGTGPVSDAPSRATVFLASP